MTCLANGLGWPAISVVGGFSADSRPLGVQLMAPRLAERRLLQVAQALQSWTDHHLRVPTEFAD